MSNANLQKLEPNGFCVYVPRMPERHKGEALNKFIGRFVSAKREKRKFPKLNQRLAVGYSEAREAARRS